MHEFATGGSKGGRVRSRGGLIGHPLKCSKWHICEMLFCENLMLYSIYDYRDLDFFAKCRLGESGGIYNHKPLFFSQKILLTTKNIIYKNIIYNFIEHKAQEKRHLVESVRRPLNDIFAGCNVALVRMSVHLSVDALMVEPLLVQGLCLCRNQLLFRQVAC